jgi:hypothetical protein
MISALIATSSGLRSFFTQISNFLSMQSKVYHRLCNKAQILTLSTALLLFKGSVVMRTAHVEGKATFAACGSATFYQKSFLDAE